MSKFIMITDKKYNKKHIYKIKDICSIRELEDNTSSILFYDDSVVDIKESIGTIHFVLEKDEE